MRKIGKKNLYINTDFFFTEIEEDLVNKENASFANSPINDIFRYLSRNFYTKSQNKIVHAHQIINKKQFFLDPIGDDVIKIIGIKDDFSSEKINKKGILEKNYNKKLWNRFISDVLRPSLGIMNEDYHFEQYSPVSLSEVKDDDPKDNFINHEFIYNFFNIDYEYIFNEIQSDVKLIPNIYNFSSAKVKEKRDLEEQLCLSHAGLIPESDVTALLLSNSYKDKLLSYFTNLAENLDSGRIESVREQITSLNTNILISEKDLENGSKIKYFPYPYYSKLSFTNLVNSEEDFIHKISNIGECKRDLCNYLVNKDVGVENLKNKRSFISERDISKSEKIREENLIEWINYGLEGRLFFPETNKLNNIERLANSTLVGEYSTIISLIKETLKNKKRSYRDILNKPAHSEILFYKIEKRQFKFNSTNTIQNFWIFPSKSEVVKFFDSQIKYATDYFYTVKAVTLVVGNKYSYHPYDYKNNELEKQEDINNCSYKFKVKNEASYKIFEIPIINFSGGVYEPPYTKPKIKIEKDGNLIRINLLESEQESSEEFKYIENKDFKIFEKIRLSQENNIANQIKSKINKSESNILEIYKLTEKPVNYLSFQGKLYKTVSLAQEKAIFDNIVPNIKYYYLFRYVNNHKTPSNVSKIYEVEIKDEDGYSYLNLSEVDLDKTYEKKLDKQMRRYLLIKPSMLQTMINVDSSNQENISVGPNANSMWNKDFIIKITSKESKRVIEFNIKSTITRKNN